MRFQGLAGMVLAMAMTAGCAGEVGLAPGDEAVVEVAAAATTGQVVKARIVQKSATARVLELVDGAGAVVATYYPGFFTAQQLVPDPDTGELTGARVKGTWFLGATINPATGKVAVAVRGFIFAETSFDLVYLIDTRSAAFSQNKYGAGALTAVPFDGRRNDGVLPTSAQAVRPWLDVTPDSLAYDAAGRLHVKTFDAAGSQAELVYNPDLSAHQCVWTYEFENPRCPQPARTSP